MLKQVRCVKKLKDFRPLVEAIFEPYVGKKCLHFESYGNIGDKMIFETTYQIFNRLNISYTARFVGDNNDNILKSMIKDHDVVFWPGGGNMGNFYMGNFMQRQKIAKKCEEYGVEFVILPQTWTGDESIIASKQYARDFRSINGRLAPDIALAYEVQQPELDFLKTVKKEKVGIFFRIDGEKTTIPEGNRGDPALLCETVSDYIRLAGQFEEIHTNRLHFAISGLHSGSQVVLYHNSYHKNQSVYQTWLTFLPEITFNANKPVSIREGL